MTNNENEIKKPDEISENNKTDEISTNDSAKVELEQKVQTLEQKQKNKKKRNIIIGTSVGVGVLLLGGAVTTAVVLTNKNTESNIINLNKAKVDNFSYEQIQKFIDENLFENENELSQQIKEYSYSKLGNNKFDAYFTADRPEVENLELEKGQYLKLEFPLDLKNAQFINENNELDPKKVYISENGKQIWILVRTPEQTFQYYTKYQIAGLEKGFNALVDEVRKESNRYTAEKFKENFDAIMPVFYNSLTVQSKGETVKFYSIISKDKTKTFFNEDNYKIEIQLIEDKFNVYNFESTHQNVKFDKTAQKLIIEGLKLYSNVNIDVKNEIKTNIQFYIDEGKREYTNAEFAANANTEEFKKVIQDSTSIKTIFMDNLVVEGDDLIIKLINDDYTNYIFNNQESLPEDVTSEKVEINGNVSYNLRISKLKFWNQSNISVNDKLRESIQNYITNPSRKSTSKEFANSLVNDSSAIKQEILKGIEGIQETSISELALDNENSLIIKLNKPQKGTKYNLQGTLPENIFVQTTAVDGSFVPEFRISKLDYYTEYTINNTQGSFEALQKEIELPSKRYTKQRFQENLKTTMEAFYNNLSLTIDSNTKESLKNFVDSEVFNEDESITVHLNADLKKYKLEENASANVQLDIENSTLTISGLTFYTEKTFTIQSTLTDNLQNLIKTDGKRYTPDEFKNATDEVKQIVVQDIPGLKAEQIESIDVDKDQNVILTLDLSSNGKYLYNIFDNTSSNISTEFVDLGNENYRERIIISGIKFYKYRSLLTESQLLQLWTDVNEAIVNNGITAAKENADLANYEAKVGYIYDVFDQTMTDDGETLSYFIGNKEENVTRELANIKIKLSNYTPIQQLDEFDLVKVEDICLNQGYVTLDSKTNTINLNNLSISNPVEIFNISEDGSVFYGFAQGKNESDILIPPSIKKISNDVFRGIRHYGSIIVPDSVTEIGNHFTYQCADINIIKLSRNITTVSDSSIASNWKQWNNDVKNLYMYNGSLNSFGSSTFYWLNQLKGNLTKNHFVIPPSVKKMNNKNFVVSGWCDVNKFTIWANEFSGLTFGGGDWGRDPRRVDINLLIDETESLDSSNNKTFEGLTADSTIFVKNEAVQQMVISKFKENGGNYKGKVVVDTTLAKQYPKEKYCPVHGIDK